MTYGLIPCVHPTHSPFEPCGLPDRQSSYPPIHLTQRCRTGPPSRSTCPSSRCTASRTMHFSAETCGHLRELVVHSADRAGAAPRSKRDDVCSTVCTRICWCSQYRRTSSPRLLPQLLHATHEDSDGSQRTRKQNFRIRSNSPHCSHLLIHSISALIRLRG